MDVLPVRIQDENTRGTAINHAEDQAHMLQYWAWSQQPVRTGVGLYINDHSCEYWLDIPLQTVVYENEGQACFAVLHQLWLEELSRLSPQVAVACERLETDFVYKMRYQGNVLKVWYTPGELTLACLSIPLAEKPISKDKWFDGRVTVLSDPPMSDDIAADFGRILLGGQLQERCDNQEVQGGQIALIASNNNIVQRPPNSLDRMHASYSKQVAYNQRVLSAESEIAGINSEAADFLSQMAVNPSEPIIICVSSGLSFKRHEQRTGGQLWMQSDRKMTDTNIPFPGMTNDAESACLAGVAEAVEWAHVLEDGLPKRTTQRVVIYLPTMSEFTRVLSGDTSNLAEGHDIAYVRISNACSKYEAPPAFFSADAEIFGGIDPEKVPLWMHTAAQVSIGGRSTVLKNRPDACNSSSDSDNEDQEETLKGIYTKEFQSIQRVNRSSQSASSRPPRMRSSDWQRH
jgi:hypothetical protein